MWQSSSRNVEGLRATLRPEYANMPAEHMESMVEPVLQGLPGTAADDFWRSLNSVGRAVSPVLERAAPSIIQGATTGATAGGPWGALIGAGAGLASSALGGSGKPPAATPT